MLFRSHVIFGVCAAQFIGRADGKVNRRLGVEVGQPSLESSRDLVLGQAIGDDVDDRVAREVTCYAGHRIMLLGLVAVGSLSQPCRQSDDRWSNGGASPARCDRALRSLRRD